MDENVIGDKTGKLVRWEEHFAELLNENAGMPETENKEEGIVDWRSM